VSFAPGQQVARYTLIRILGTGGMGEVWEAHDDQLARRVAIKVLRAGVGDPARLVREARALAKLSHPVVVTVFDVGTDEAGRVWVAMELLTGGTLRHWLATPRSWREIVATFARVGRGLAAAHAAKLVHRDFKPENVLLRDTGEPVVADFGLARSTEDGTAMAVHAPPSREPAGMPTARDDASSTPARRNDAILEDGPEYCATVPSPARDANTRPGAITGTPPYMAPEQHLGRDVDARADQFAFAVTLWEGLFGHRPFAIPGDRSVDAEAWALAIIHGRREPVPPRPAIPRWLRAILERALAGDRDARFPAMEAVVRALDRGLARRRLAIAGGLGGLAIGATVLVTAMWSGSGAGAEPVLCEGAAAHMQGVWDRARREQVAAGFSASGAGFATAAFERVAPLLDARRDAWVAMHTGACLATNVERTQSPALLDRRMACLDERRTELVALVDALAAPDAAAIAAAHAAVVALPPLASCTDPIALDARAPRRADPAVQARLDVLAAELARASAIGHLGRYREAIALESRIAGEAEQLDAPAIVARARYYEGIDAHHLGDPDRAKRAFEDATRAAAAAGDDALAAEVWAELVMTLADYRRVTEAEALIVAADAAVRRSRDRASARQLLIQAEGWIAIHKGDLKRARERFAAGLAIAARSDAPARIRALGNLATVESELADHASAIAHRRDVLAAVEATFGSEHPLYADSIAELGQAQRRAGDIVAALGSLRDAVRRLERGYGADSPNVAQALHTLANTLSDAKQPAAAIVALERAVAIYEAAKSPRLDAALGSLAGMRYETGDVAGAIRDMKRALPAIERRVGRDHFEYAAYEGNYGTMVDCATGMPHLEHAIQVLEKTLGAEHQYTRDTARTREICRRELAGKR